MSLFFLVRIVLFVKMFFLFYILKIVLFYWVCFFLDLDSDWIDELMDKLKSVNILVFYILREYFFFLILINILFVIEWVLLVYYCVFWKLIRLFVIFIFFLFVFCNIVIYNVNRFFCIFWFWYFKENWIILKLINNFIRNYGLEFNFIIFIIFW